MKTRIILSALIICLTAAASCRDTQSPGTTEDSTPSEIIETTAAAETTEEASEAEAETETAEPETQEKTEAVTEESTRPKKVFKPDESDIVVLDENDYSGDKIVSETDTLLLYKPTMKITEAYPDMTYEYIEFPEDFYPMFYAGNGIWYDNYVESVELTDNGMIRRYNQETGELSVLIDPEGDTACSAFYITDKYLFWKESPNNYWATAEYHAYNLETGEDINYYDAATDPSSDSAYYTVHNVPPAFIDGKLYYDDIIDRDENNIPHRIIYSYDPEADEFEIIYDDAMLPLEYKGELAWFSRSEDGENGVFCTKDGGILKATSKLGVTGGAAGDLIFFQDSLSYNSYNILKNNEKVDTEAYVSENDMAEFGTFSYGAKIFRNGKAEPIVLSGGEGVSYITDLTSNGKQLGWCGSNNGQPMFYDSEKDVIIEIDFITETEVDTYSTEFFDDKLFIMYADVFGEEPYTRYMMISLE